MISRQLPLAQRKRQCQCQTFNKPYNCGGDGLVITTAPQSSSANSAHHETEKISTPKERGDNK